MLTDIESKRLEIAIAELDKQFGARSIYRLGDENIQPVEVVKTGALNLDIALGVKGLPKGRIVEIFGPESAGKSTLALSVVAEAQKEGGTCAYIDAEHAVDPIYAKTLGVNMDDLLFAQPDYAEMALDILNTIVKTGTIDVVVVDSVAALVPKVELDGEMGDQQMGLQARLMAKSMRKIVGAASENGTLVIFINQLRQKIGIVFGNPEVTTGGLALKYAASVRLDIRTKDKLKDSKGNVYGSRAIVKVIKNKMAPPLKQAEFDILYGRGINSIGCILDLAVEYGIVLKSGAWYSYNGEQLGQGSNNTCQFLSQDLDLLKTIEAQVLNGGQ